MRQIMLAAPQYNCRLFRNNTGILKDARGRHVKFGLCVGSSDLIGLTCDGRFLAVEVKREGKHPTKEQQRFIAMVDDMGGIAFVAHSVEEFNQMMRASL